MIPKVYLYIIVMALVTNGIRIIPLILVRKEIENEFIKSFLYYVPYVTLAVMTFPAIIDTTVEPFVGILAMILGIIAAWKGGSLITVAGICCIAVFVLENFLI